MRRIRSDSTAAAVQTTRAVVAGIPQPPAHIHLRDRDLPFYESIAKARPLVTWNDSDLEVAANLARAKADVERIQQEIDAEGDVIENARGTPVMNPKHTVLEMLSRRVLACSRMLHVHAEATNGKAREQTPKAKAQKAVEEAVVQARGDDDLIPGLTILN